MKLNLPNLFSNKGKRGKRNNSLNVNSSQMTSVLLVVIVILVIYFIFLDDRKKNNQLPYIQGKGNVSVGINDKTRLGGGADMSVDNDGARGSTNAYFNLNNNTGLGGGADMAVDRDGARGTANAYLNLDEDTQLGVAGGVSVDDKRAVGGGGIRVGDPDDVVYAGAKLSYNNKYGAMAGVGFDDELYGVSTGYNSDRDKLYLDVGELEHFQNQNNKVVPGPNKCAIVFFAADWCGHCKKFKPTWQQFKQKMNGKTVNGKEIVVTEVSSEDVEKVKNYEVSGYPTVKAINSNGEEIKEFEGERTVSGLVQFANNASRY